MNNNDDAPIKVKFGQPL